MTNSDKLESWMRRYAEGLKAKPQKAQQPTQSNPPLPKTNPIMLPQFTEEFMFLEGDLGMQVHQEIQSKYKKLKCIQANYDISQQRVIDSNPFYVVAVNEVLREQNIPYRTATQADLERILRRNSLDLTQKYVDTSLVWRSNQGINAYLAIDLFEQCKKQGINLVEGISYVFPLNALSLRKDYTSPNEFSFNIFDHKSIFKSSILSVLDREYFNSLHTDKNGLPDMTYNDSFMGERQLKNTSNGLSRLYLYFAEDIFANDPKLDEFYFNGRVVLVSTKNK